MKHVIFQKGFRPIFLPDSVFGAGLVPWWTRTTLIVSAACWAVAFAVYSIVNHRYLATPRPDGKAV